MNRNWTTFYMHGQCDSILVAPILLIPGPDGT